MAQEQELDNESQQGGMLAKGSLMPFGSIRWDVRLPSTIEFEGDVDDEEMTVVEGSTGLSPQLSLEL